MLRTTELLLIGSYAAYLRGVLPQWRSGRVGDVDFVGTPQAVEALLEFYGYQAVAQAPDRRFVTNRHGFAFDISLRGHLIPSVAAYADLMPVTVNGRALACLVARPELIFALRHESWDLVPVHLEKARRDVAGYAALGIEADPTLSQAAKAFRMNT